MWDDYKDRLTSLFKDFEGFAEVRLERKRTLSIRMRNGNIESFNRTNNLGGFVRVLLPGRGWGVATLNSIDKLEQAFKDAVEASRVLIPDEPIKLAEVKPVVDKVENIMEDPYHAHSDEEKIDILRKHDELMHQHGGGEIAVTTGVYAEVFTEKLYANSIGSLIEHNLSDGFVYAVAQAKRGSDVQQCMKSRSSRNRFSDLTKLDDMVIDAAKTAKALLDAKPVEGGVYTVVIDPQLAGVFIHEAFGHLSEADFIIENPQAQKLMTLGRKFGPEFLNVIDDGTVMPELHGTIVYDDEGVPAQKTYLIKEGVLVGRLHSRETAGKLGEKPTGNARAQSYSFQPLVRMTNTAIEPGPHSAKHIFDGIKLGVYAIDAYGGQTELENFSFSAGHAYMIRDGKVAEMVRDVVLQGNLFETLANIEQIADDFQWGRWAGNCGKGGQSVPVDVGAPHIRIKNVTIGGRK